MATPPFRRLRGAATHPAGLPSGTNVHPFAMPRQVPAFRMNNAARYAPVRSCFGAVASLLLIAVLGACGGFGASVDSWSVGSAEVSGALTNDTGSGCTDTEVTVKFLDHNSAVVTDWSFGAGEVAAGQTKTWTTHMFDIVHPDRPVPASVTSASASAECADQH